MIPHFNICGHVAKYGNDFYYRFFGHRELNIFENEFLKFSTGRKKITYNKNFKTLINKMQSLSEFENPQIDNFNNSFHTTWEFYISNDKTDLAEYHAKSMMNYKEIYRNTFSYLNLLTEMNYTRSNQLNSLIATIVSILATIISVITLLKT